MPSNVEGSCKIMLLLSIKGQTNRTDILTSIQSVVRLVRLLGGKPMSFRSLIVYDLYILIRLRYYERIDVSKPSSRPTSGHNPPQSNHTPAMSRSTLDADLIVSSRTREFPPLNPTIGETQYDNKPAQSLQSTKSTLGEHPTPLAMSNIAQAHPPPSRSRQLSPPQYNPPAARPDFNEYQSVGPSAPAYTPWPPIPRYNALQDRPSLRPPGPKEREYASEDRHRRSCGGGGYNRRY